MTNYQVMMSMLGILIILNVLTIFFLANMAQKVGFLTMKVESALVSFDHFSASVVKFATSLEHLVQQNKEMHREGRADHESIKHTMVEMQSQLKTLIQGRK